MPTIQHRVGSRAGRPRGEVREIDRAVREASERAAERQRLRDARVVVTRIAKPAAGVKAGGRA